MRNRQYLLFATLFGVLSFAAGVYACKVPVFRYALERWPADRYTMVAIINSESKHDVATGLKALESISESHTNVNVEVLDLSKLTEAELWSVEGLEDTDDVPVLQVFYPEGESGQRRLCWSGDLTATNIAAWRQSPLRHRIAEQLQAGASVVWLFVEGSDQKENEAMLTQLEQALDEAESVVSIPDGVIRRQDAAMALEKDASLSMDDVLRCDVPLQVKFETIVLPHDEATEAPLRAMALGLTVNVETPCVLPIFGRGRMIEPLSMSSFDKRSVTKACDYLFGECSCSVKALNPGVDLLLEVDWQQILGSQIVVSATGVSVEAEPLAIPPGRETSRQHPPRQTANKTRFGVIANLLVGFLTTVVTAGIALFLWSRFSANTV